MNRQPREIRNIQQNDKRILDWRRPFRRPRKIREGDCIEGTFAISEEEFLLLQEYSNGKSVDNLAWGMATHKSTIIRTMRQVIGKIIKKTRLARRAACATVK